MIEKTVSHRVLAGFLLAVVSAWICPSVSRAEFAPLPGPIDRRVRTVPYVGDQIYRLRGFVGYQIDIEFAPGEAFVGLGAGDIEGLAYVAAENHLFLKPRAVKVATNLTVLTTQRHYQFDYSVLPLRPVDDDPETIFVLRFTYPPGAEQADSSARGAVDTDLKQAATLRLRNVEYWYCGVSELQPVSASDDGVHTRFRFAATGDLPAIFILNDDGSESLLNYNMDDGDMVIHRVGRRFVLRRGKLVGCVVNKGFSGGGLRLDSGTVTPQVERRLKEKTE